MRNHDVSVRRLELARERFSNKISEKPSSQEVSCQKEAHGLTNASPEDPALSTSANDSLELVSGTGDTKARKRRRGKKRKEKKKRIDQQLEEQDLLLYDETLLAVIGILDATKRETNVAAWMRSGGLIQSLMGQDHSDDTTASVESDGAIEDPKKIKMSRDNKQSSENEDGVSLVSKQAPSLPLERPSREEADRSEIKIESNRVQVDPFPGRRVEGENDVEHQLWFSYPAIKAFWVSRGRRVLKGLEIDIVSGVIGPTE